MAYPVELCGVSTRFGQTWVHRRIDLAVAAGQSELGVHMALLDQGRPGHRDQGLVRLVTGMDQARRLADGVSLLAAEDVAELPADQLEQAIARQCDADLGMVEHRFQLGQKGLHLDLPTGPLLDHLAKGIGQLADFAAVLGPVRHAVLVIQQFFSK